MCTLYPRYNSCCGIPIRIALIFIAILSIVTGAIINAMLKKAGVNVSTIHDVKMLQNVTNIKFQASNDTLLSSRRENEYIDTYQDVETSSWKSRRAQYEETTIDEQQPVTIEILGEDGQIETIHFLNDELSRENYDEPGENEPEIKAAPSTPDTTTTKRPHSVKRPPHTIKRPHSVKRPPHTPKRPHSVKRPPHTAKRPHSVKRPPHTAKRPHSVKRPPHTAKRPYHPAQLPHTTKRPHDPPRPLHKTKRPHSVIQPATTDSHRRASTDSAESKAHPTDSAEMEAQPTDSAEMEAQPTDSAETEANPTDSAETEAHPTDPAETEANPTDPAETEANPTDPAETEAHPTDSAETKAQPTDSGESESTDSEDETDATEKSSTTELPTTTKKTIITKESLFKAMGFVNKNGLNFLAMMFIALGILLLVANFLNSPDLALLYVVLMIATDIAALVLLVGVVTECTTNYSICVLRHMDWLSAFLVTLFWFIYIFVWAFFAAVANTFANGGVRNAL